MVLRLGLDTKISVVVPIFNKLATLTRTIDNILCSLNASAFKNCYELVLVDDGSTDGCGDLVDCYVNSRVVVFHKENGGPSSARNYGVERSIGEFVLFLDADDLITPEYFSFLYDAFQKYPDRCAFASDYKPVDFDSFWGGCETASYSGDARVERNFYRLWYKRAFLFTSSVCIRRSFLIENSIEFPEGRHSGEDQYVWFKVNDLHPFVVTRCKAVFYLRNVKGALTGRPVCEVGPHIDYLNSQERKNCDSTIYAAKLYKKLLCNVIAANVRARSFREAFLIVKKYGLGVLTLLGVAKIALSLISPKLYRYISGGL
ncbi:glycosyltransferase family 2 protein [Teredinibacter turnerae]|uniref:glycosyltransferase family 2 protein n=1 Tax=Teredinibacter turnerae TaxID=2426 RepID=UPI0003F593A3|nr:glycosyltransferase family 2 protein [Teredinibacter turnerae]